MGMVIILVDRNRFLIFHKQNFFLVVGCYNAYYFQRNRSFYTILPSHFTTNEIEPLHLFKLKIIKMEITLNTIEHYLNY